MRHILALGFLGWCVFITVGAGVLGSGLNCEYGDCRDGSPPWLEPWTWGDYYVYPTAFFIGLSGLVAASAFVGLVWKGRHRAAAGALVVTLALLSYPFFAGLTPSGRMLFWPGALLGLAALLTSRSGKPVTA